MVVVRMSRMPEYGMRFTVSHAIASWPDGEAIEILAIIHSTFASHQTVRPDHKDGGR